MTKTKITAAEAASIARGWRESGMSQESFGARYGVAARTIRHYEKKYCSKPAVADVEKIGNGNLTVGGATLAVEAAIPPGIDAAKGAEVARRQAPSTLPAECAVVSYRVGRRAPSTPTPTMAEQDRLLVPVVPMPSRWPQLATSPNRYPTIF